METFWKVICTVLLSVVLSIAVARNEQDIALVLSIVVCCISACAAITYLEPVLDFFWELQRSCSLPGELLSALLKAVGIALVTEISSTVCTDAGRGALGKMLQLLGGAAVLSLSVPIFRILMTTIREMVGAL